jgi:salicylate hydroxylase
MSRSAPIVRRPNASSPPSSVPRAIIAGAGIGGLSAAIALARIGWDVAVFERAPVMEEFGAGIQISPNAARALSSLGALEAVERRASAPDAIRIRRARDGADLALLPLKDAVRRWGAPYLVIHRADLQRALLECAAALPGISLAGGAEVAGVASDADGVSVELKRGALATRERADLLIGADGLRSIVRELVGFGGRGDAPFAGRVAYRATAADAPRRFRGNEVGLWLGPNAHLVHYPLRSGVNIVAVVEVSWRGAEEDAFDGAADTAVLDRAFAAWAPDARALLAAAGGWRAWPLHHRPPIPAWSAGRVALLGDAAHPMTPFLAQGAAQAIEDAAALGAALAVNPDVEAALAAYSARRAPRAARVQREALEQARLYHMRGPLAAARDLGIRMLGPRRLLARYDWLYGG